MLTLIQEPNSTGTYLGGKESIKRLATLPPPPPYGEAKDAKLKRIVNNMAEI